MDSLGQDALAPMSSGETKTTHYDRVSDDRDSVVADTLNVVVAG